VLIEVFAGDCARNRRLARTSKAVQPENAPLVLFLGLVVYLLKEVDAGIGKASRFVLLRVGVEGRFSYVG